jgi:putative ABC transport system permease protein
MMRELMAKELMRNRLRTALTILGVAIGVLLIVSLSSFSEGITILVNQEISYSTGLVSVIQNGISFQNIFYSKVDEDLIDEFAGISGVDESAGFIMGFAPGVGFLGGIDFEKADMYSQINVGLDEGRWPADGADELAVGWSAKDRLGVSVGDDIMIDKKAYEVVGIMQETGTTDDEGVMTSLKTAQDVLKMEGKVTMITLKPVDIAYARDVADQINQEYMDSNDVTAGTDEDVRKFAATMTGQMSAMTFGLGSIALIIAGVVIMNVMFMTVRERRREIGVMKAIGATNRQVLVEIVAESMSISLIGAFLGLGLSFFSVGFINGIIGSNLAVITANLAAEAVLFTTLIGMLAGIAPARQAARLNPVEAIRYE